MNDLMIDMETLGVSVTSPIISIGAVFFDPEIGVIGETYYRVVKLDSALAHGQIEPRTLSWWMGQSNEARAIFSTTDAVSLDVVLQQLGEFIRNESNPKTVHVWGNGPSFDNAILAHAYQKMGFDLPWSFRNDRDVRTITDLAKRIKKIDPILLTERRGVHHNALDDALYQANYVSAAYQALRG